MYQSINKMVAQYCKKHHLLEHGDKIIVGVSGGADSVCLLFLLLSMQKDYDLKLHVVHVNHGIREDAKEDAAYVERLCSIYGLPFHLYEKNIAQIAKERACGEEEAGRMVRYEAFYEVMKEEKCDKIAVAHNSNDRAETMLFHLFRGTGLAGLASIRPKRNDIIRPILCLGRNQIEEYLKENRIEYRHDSTNDTDEYTRNKIRHNILPYAQSHITYGCVANMHRTADILAETEDYLVWQTENAISRCLKRRTAITTNEGSYRLDVQSFLKEHSLIQKRLVFSLLKALTPQNKDISYIHVEDTLSLFHIEGNRSISLPYGITGSRQYDSVLLENKSQEDTWKRNPAAIRKEILAREEIRIQIDKNRYLFLNLFPYPAGSPVSQIAPQSSTTKYFDYDKIEDTLTIRTRKEGDYISIRSGGTIHHKKLKDYMIEEKIPKQNRERVPLLAAGEHILWALGYRISEYYKVKDTTKTVLQETIE